MALPASQSISIPPLGLPLSALTRSSDNRPEDESNSFGIGVGGHQRPRSDTMLTASSSASSSSTVLQTPQSPSILGVLSNDYISANKDRIAQSTTTGRNVTRRRMSSYDFGAGLPVAVAVQDAEMDVPPRPEPGAEAEHEHLGQQGIGGEDPELELAEVEDQLVSPAMEAGTLGQQAQFLEHPLMDPFTAIIDPPTPPGGDPRIDTHDLILDPSNDVLGAPHLESPHARSSTGLKLTVQRKLERSKSSLKDLLSPQKRVKRDEDDLTETDGYGNATGSSDGAGPSSGSGLGRRSRPRLRSLLSLSSRSPSTLSILTTTSAASLSGHGPHNPERLDSSVALSPEPQDEITNIPSPGGMKLTIDSANVGDGLAPRPLLIKGKGRAPLLSRLSFKARGPLPPVASTDYQLSLHAGSAPPAPPFIRSTTLPLPADDAMVRSVRQNPSLDRKIDLFSTMLPRELQIKVLKHLVDGNDNQPRIRKWDGRPGAQRNLIRLIRVSKYWMDLCLDGQLWQIADLGPLANDLYPYTLVRILGNTMRYTTTLSLRGMDANISLLLSGLIISSYLKHTERTCSLPSLTHLDLRGCTSLTESTLIAFLKHAPGLQVVNVKGLRGVGCNFIRQIPQSTPNLASLDVSRCWSISLCDMTAFIRRLSPAQGQKLKVLRIAGLKGYGPAVHELLPAIAECLVNLEGLDLGGITSLSANDFERWAQALPETRSDHTSGISGISDARPASAPSLRHLILSACDGLLGTVFPHLTNRMPNLTHLELAGMPALFGSDEPQQVNYESPFIAFLRSTPKIERLDLEGSGRDGGIGDRFLRCLTPTPWDKRGEVIGKRLVELRIGYARAITPGVMVDFIRATPKLRVLELDNTRANDTVMHAFYRQHPHGASISLVDCRAITPSAYSHVSPHTRARDGWAGWEATPMSYDRDVEVDERTVIKSFWSWRRVRVIPGGWREVLFAAAAEEAGTAEDEAKASSGESTAVALTGAGAGAGAAVSKSRRARNHGRSRISDLDDSGSCTVQ